MAGRKTLVSDMLFKGTADRYEFVTLFDYSLGRFSSVERAERWMKDNQSMGPGKPEPGDSRKRTEQRISPPERQRACGRRAKKRPRDAGMGNVLQSQAAKSAGPKEDAPSSSASINRTIIRLTPDHISLPEGGKQVLAGIAWPNDASRRADFLERCSIHHDALSRDQLVELSNGGGINIQRQLNKWGVSDISLVEWLLEPHIAPMTEEERERARRDAITEASNLRADLIYREHKEREKRLRVTGKGHAAQSTAKQVRAETCRKDAKELREKDTNKSKSALAAQLVLGGPYH
jgi:hypothetical protein